MWKKTMLTIGLAGVLTVPVGMALAANGNPVRNQNPVTTMSPGQTWGHGMIGGQLRLHDPATCDGTGPMNGHPGTGWDPGTPGAGYGQGAMDGSGPIHTPPADGTGFRFGAAWR